MKRVLVSGVATCALLGGLLAQAPAVADEVGSATVVPIQVTGDPANRFNLVILGDGYTADEMDQFRAAVDHHLNVQWSMEPYRSYRNYMNVYAVEIVSGESGVSCDPDLDSPRRTTPLSMSFWGGCNASSVQRLLTMSSSAANQYASLVPGVTSANRQILALGNSQTYGGAGGTFATASSDNALSALISPHELGHSLGGLQDEYLYFARNQDRGDMPGTSEPSSIHHTRMSSEEMIANQAKWWRWLGEESESGGPIRAADPDGYEGGMYYSGNVWRPSDNSNMKSLGYYYDQVSRERMTQRLSGRTPLIDSSTPTGQSVAIDEVVWVKVLHPVYHELDVVWRINGEIVPDTSNSGDLDLGALGVAAGDELTVTVQDPTEFVRDPAIRNSSSMTRTRSWTVGSHAATPTDTEVEITNSTPTDRGAGHDEVVFIETTQASDRVFDVTWQLNGEVVSDSGKTLDLADFDLEVGAHTLTATVTDPDGPGSDSISWTVDNTGPTTEREISAPLAELGGDAQHHVYFNEFTMGLEPSDDQPGALIGEFRVDDDGWHNYYGWATSTELPFLFTHSGTNVDDLVYGSLGKGGLSKAPFEQFYGPDDPNGPFVPGFGTFTIGHRAIDAAGNHGTPDEFVATVLPGEALECTNTITGREHRGRLMVRDGVTCLDDATLSGGVTVTGGALVASGSTINGGLSVSGAEAVHLFNTSVNGSSNITETASSVVIAGSEFRGRLALTNNTQVAGDDGAARFAEFGVDYGPIVVGSTIRGSLSCSGNSAPVYDFGAANTITGDAGGDCAAL